MDSKWGWGTVIISIMAISFAILLFVFPWKFGEFNKNLQEVNYIISYTSLIFSAGALLVASLAFKASVTGPKLKLQIVPYDAKKTGPALRIDADGKIDLSRPYNEWSLNLINIGKVSAINPLVKIEFYNIFFGENDLEGWMPIEHAHAMGWYGFQWIPGQSHSSMIHVGFKTKLPTFFFHGQFVENPKAPKLKITIAADKMKTTSYTLPIKIVSL
ncbi:UNVERIFIED_CONTAM: hypothetical protein N8J90_07000 [Halobacillus marinus]